MKTMDMNDNVIDIYEFNQRRYSLNMCYGIINGKVSEYPLILHSYSGDTNSEVTFFSEFLYYSSTNRAIDIIHKSTNSITKKHGRFIVMFLNYVFYDSKKPISKIEDVTKDMAQQFLQRYAKGLEGKKQSKCWHTVRGGELVLTCFLYWLVNNYPERFKYIKLTDFTWLEYYSIDSANSMANNYKKIKYKRLESIFAIDIDDDDYITREKVVTGSLYMVLTLLEIAKKHDPMLRLGIALGAFAGLRKGEVCQMNKRRIRTFEPHVNIQFETTIDLTYNEVIRSDGQLTGYIKVKKERPVYEAFLPMLNEIYNDHLDMLNERGINNKYGALFMDERGNAMMDYTYLDRFNKLVDIMEDNFRVAALEKGYSEAKEEYSQLQGTKFTPHSLRYFFSQYIIEKEKNPIVLQRYRVDKQLATQMGYIIDSKRNEELIKQMQEEIKKDATKHIEEIQELFRKQADRYNS